ncbi:MAG TPA: hypothetical protein VLV15_14025 [Dongiaceae bacterium]|nr:hypothetical protein [Dongiaceae bacterium]
MFILRIEHPVPDYDRWRTAFENDPLDRRKAGVRRYRVLRAIDEPNHVFVDLEFDTRPEAEAMLAALKTLWGRVEGKVMTAPRSRIVEVAETREL